MIKQATITLILMTYFNCIYLDNNWQKPIGHSTCLTKFNHHHNYPVYHNHGHTHGYGHGHGHGYGHKHGHGHPIVVKIQSKRRNYWNKKSGSCSSNEKWGRKKNFKKSYSYSKSKSCSKGGKYSSKSYSHGGKKYWGKKSYYPKKKNFIHKRTGPTIIVGESPN